MNVADIDRAATLLKDRPIKLVTQEDIARI
jgi:hypothetical protein